MDKEFEHGSVRKTPVQLETVVCQKQLEASKMPARYLSRPQMMPEAEGGQIACRFSDGPFHRMQPPVRWVAPMFLEEGSRLVIRTGIMAPRGISKGWASSNMVKRLFVVI